MAKTMLFNPYTGKPRDPRDIASDPAGILVVDPDEPLFAASQQRALSDSKDAARYRHLRDQNNSLETQQRDKGIVNGPSCYHQVDGIWELKSGDELDNAIDSAILAAAGGSQ